MVKANLVYFLCYVIIVVLAIGYDTGSAQAAVIDGWS